MTSRILFVDDEGIVLKSLNRALSTTYDITTAYSAEEALGLLADQKFAVIVTDMRMPGGDGMWLIRKASEICSHCQFIVLTGNCDDATRENAMATGKVFAFLNKPCPIELLEEQIEKAIAARMEAYQV
ncbi:Hydrogenase transcriptional regulatory protein hupR1 [Posidoniimonas polymericola]|uniref:Hydrogenase transcriptional regulatory protein hupR1 n=1 Tax=Posidoniimonas polymericola TaxID=2528002 RepID=A0A5C5YQD4_9BACT|nr:response regulator [Posidoniimonas polymericola]TWT77125.1 Hydrogenase transcriptional regulatory protein hupR1 [Posidoniimonas polymericola]